MAFKNLYGTAFGTWLFNLREHLLRGWKTLGVAVRRVRDADVELIAGSLSYTTALSMVPLLAVSLSVFHWLGGLEGLMKQIEPFILSNLVESSGVELSRYLSRAIRRVHSGALGVGGVIGVMLASMKLFNDLDRAIQRVWLLKKRRSFWKRFLVYSAVMFVAPLLVAGLLGVFGLKSLGLMQVVPRSSLTIVFALVGLFAIYKWVPARRVDFRPAMIAAVVGTIGLALAQGSYASVMRVIFRFSKVYGGLAGIPLFLMWVFLVWWIVLMAATLAAILQERQDRAQERWDGVNRRERTSDRRTVR